MINFDKILNRENIKEQIKDFLHNFEKNKSDITIQRGIYIYGNSGSGKTYFIEDILKSINYDTILYNASDIRNKNIIDNITQNNMSNQNVVSLFQGKKKNIAIVMDEIDGMNSGDKGGINTLIKIIRPKKTKKQKLEEISSVPIICIGNNQTDKKIKELMKNCLSIELKSPTTIQIKNILMLTFTELKSNKRKKLLSTFINYIDCDMRKFNTVKNIYGKNTNITNIINDSIILKYFESETLTNDVKEITNNIITNNYSIDDHNKILGETERTTVALIWHENIVDYLPKPKIIAINIYLKVLDNICFSDYIDRITFQKQIWQFNEMSSLIKTFYNNFIINNNKTETLIKPISKNISKNITENITENKEVTSIIQDIRFTKILTKYSTEYNNFLFVQMFCQELMMDKNDMINYFIYLKDNDIEDKITQIYEHTNIKKLDINRLYRYIDI